MVHPPFPFPHPIHVFSLPPQGKLGRRLRRRWIAVPRTEGAYYTYTGVIHCHSHYSDGTGSVQEILRAAHKCRLDYVIITDHNTLLPREVLGEGWYGNVLLLFGQEISPEKNHYLALDLKKAVPPQADPQSYIKAVKEQGGIGFIAHPADRGNSFFQIPPYPWADYAVAGFDGIEIWNYFSDLGAEMTSWFRCLAGYFFPLFLLKGPSPQTLAWWDQVNQKGHVAAIGGLDAHGIRISMAGFSLVLFPYHQLFRTLRTYVLTRIPWQRKPGDRELLLASLKRGNSYLALNLLGEARDFSFIAQTGEGIFLMGDEISGSRDVLLRIKVPATALVRLIYNGRPYREKYCRGMEIPVAGKGIYRIEVYRVKAGTRLYPWIFSNPIYIR